MGPKCDENMLFSYQAFWFDADCPTLNNTCNELADISNWDGSQTTTCQSSVKKKKKKNKKKQFFSYLIFF